MFIVTHSTQAAITLSTCCEVSSNERTLNLRPYHMHHSTLTLSTINLTAAHKRTTVRHNKLFPIELLKPPFTTTTCLSSIFCLLYLVSLISKHPIPEAEERALIFLPLSYILRYSPFLDFHFVLEEILWVFYASEKQCYIF